MGSIIDGFNQVWRDYVTDGMPGSGINDPSKSEARGLGALIEGYVATSASAAAAAGGAAKLILDVGDETTSITTGTAKKTFRLPYGLLLSEVRASLSTASGSGNVQVDINVGGVSILSAVLQVDATTKTSVGSVAPPTILTHELDDNAEVTIDIDAAGSGAKGLKVHMIGTWAAFGVGATPTFIDHRSTWAASNDTIAAAYPSGYTPTDGDIALLQIFSGTRGGTAGTVSRPSGWATMASIGKHVLFWRRLDGSEGASQTVITTGGSGIIDMGAEISIWRDCVGAGDPFESLATNSGSSAAMTSTSIVTLGPNRRALNLYTQNAAYASDQDVGFTEVFDDANGIFDPVQFAGSAQAVPVAATVGTETRSLGGSAAWACWSFALVPGT